MAIIPKLALIPSGYKAGTLYSVLPTNGDGDFTTSRSSSATRLNKSGLIETVLSNVPRLDYSDGSCPSLLLEPQRTNNLRYSEDLTHAVWNKISGGTGTNPVVTANYSLSPSGEQNAYRIVFNQGSGTTDNDYSIFRQNVSSVGQGVSSVYIKSNTNNNYVIGIDEVGLGTKNVTVTTEWQRFEYSESTNDRLQLSLRGNSQSSYADVSVWGAQMEAGSYPTSYIPTNGSAVTRNADLAKKGGLSNSIGQTEGTVFLDFEYLLEIGTNSSNDALRDIFVVGSNFNTTNIISVDNYRSQFRIFITANGVTSSIGLGGSGTAQANTRYKLAFRYKSGDSKAFLNGVQMGSSTNSVNFTNTIDSVFFSYNNSSNSFKNQKKVNGLQIFTEALTDAELQTLTTI